MNYFEDELFEHKNYTIQPIEIGEYEECTFINCDFSECDLSKIDFTNCEFK